MVSDSLCSLPFKPYSFIMLDNIIFSLKTPAEKEDTGKTIEYSSRTLEFMAIEEIIMTAGVTTID